MQVLVKNLYAREIDPGDVIESFWSPDCLYMGKAFSMSSLMELSDMHGYSPFYVLDARVALLTSLVNEGSSLLKGMGSLGSLCAFMKTGSGNIVEDKEREKAKRYLQEYLPSDPFVEKSLFDQVVTFGDSCIDENLWKKLKAGGFYIMGTNGRPELSGYKFEAFGKIFPIGEATEYGWRFDQEDLGLGRFEIVKIKKL